MWHFLSYWVMAGFILPVVVLLITQLQGGVFEWPYLALVLWPTLPIAVVADLQPEPSPLSVILIYSAISIELNTIIYSVFGALFWALYRSYRSIR